MEEIIKYLISSGVLLAGVKYFTAKTQKKIQEDKAKTETVQRGVQALLRDRLYQSYNHYKEKGYAPLYAKENFENMYNQYHNLGLNGVMEEVRDKFLELPEKKEEEE